MAEFIPDDFNWRDYERKSEVGVKVRGASEWLSDLVDEFAFKDDAPVLPTVSSIAKLNGRLEFRSAEVTVWAGYNGHRKSMFLGQVILDLLASGERCLIASMEMLPRRTLARMARQASANRYPTPSWLERFGGWTDGRLWIFDHVGTVTPAVMLALCRYFAEEHKGKHVVIDSMMMVCASEESLDEQKQFATALVRIAQETGLHIHVVAHCRKPQAGEEKPPTKYDVRGSASITDQAPNVVTVWSNKSKEARLSALKASDDADAIRDEPDAIVSVEKQRNGAYEGKVKLWFCESSMRFTSTRMEPVQPYLE